MDLMVLPAHSRYDRTTHAFVFPAEAGPPLPHRGWKTEYVYDCTSIALVFEVDDVLSTDYRLTT